MPPNKSFNPTRASALRAARAALLMKKEIESYHETVAPQYHLSFGVGINYGTAVVGMVGTRLRLDYSAIGDDVNLASRVAGIAGPGEVVASEATVTQIALDLPGVTFEEIGPVFMKGIPGAVRLFRVSN